MADKKKQRYDREEKLLQLQNSTTLLAILASKADVRNEIKKLSDEPESASASEKPGAVKAIDP